MVLIGSHDGRRDGERWGAIWWYGFLIRQMENAGPTFIKVESIKLSLLFYPP
jgi:aarF domain-containing kinase